MGSKRVEYRWYAEIGYGSGSIKVENTFFVELDSNSSAEEWDEEALRIAVNFHKIHGDDSRSVFHQTSVWRKISYT